MIRVNEKEFDENVILHEMQYHNGKTQRESMIKASESLIISELVKQRGAELSLDAENQEDDEFLDALLAKDVHIPTACDEDCQTYYQQNTEKFMSTPLLAVRHILLAADPEDETARIAAEDLGKHLIQQLEEDPSRFVSLAKTHSICPSKNTEGQLGQLSRGQTVEEFERQVFKCQPGLVASPISTRYGVHIVEVLHRVDGRVLPYEMVAERIKEYLDEKVKRKSIAQYIETLISNATIEGFDFSVSESPLMQ